MHRLEHFFRMASNTSMVRDVTAVGTLWGSLYASILGYLQDITTVFAAIGSVVSAIYITIRLFYLLKYGPEK